jgi:glycosyltransferase involved in cell wall biosynthesis
MKPIIICLTPTKNEEWIIERFLKCASLWADYIIIADQGSTDKTVEIAKRFSKVILVENKSGEYNEKSRQELLLSEARKIPGKKLLFALDADEFLTANAFTSLEWKTLLEAPSGTVFTFKWLNIHPNFTTVTKDNRFRGNWAYMDDGVTHSSTRKIHTERLPYPDNATHIHCNEIFVLHYAYVDKQRLESKKRWYMCWEFINLNVDYRTLHKKYVINHELYGEGLEVLPLEKCWLEGYADIDMTSVSQMVIHFAPNTNMPHAKKLLPIFWWDYEVLEMIEKYGAQRFQFLSIWNYDFSLLAKFLNKSDCNIFCRPHSLKIMLFDNLLVQAENQSGLRLRFVEKLLSRIS